MKRLATLRTTALMACLLAGILAGSAGCSVLGFAVYSIFPQKVKAMYVPPKTPMLVMVENRANPGMLVAEGEQLANFIMDDLSAYNVAPLIPHEKLEELRDTRSDIDRMTISQIGKAIGARQVLYVDLQRIRIGGGDGIPNDGRVECRVYIVDVETGTTAFPVASAEGWPVSLETPISARTREQDLPLVRERLLRTLGTRIGSMFHDRKL